MNPVQWMSKALCTEVGWLQFFPTPTEPARNAIAVCKRCEVQTQCLEYAITHHEYGVWGGTTTRQRAALRREAA